MKHLSDCDKQAWQDYSDNELYGEILSDEWFKEHNIECTCEETNDFRKTTKNLSKVIIHDDGE